MPRMRRRDSVHAFTRFSIAAATLATMTTPRRRMIEERGDTWGIERLAMPGLGYNLGGPPMCDYSLHLVAHRPAAVGDKLVTTCFRNSTTHGFMAPAEPVACA